MKYLLLLLVSFLVSCAGPISPFGSLPATEIELINENLNDLTNSRTPASITGEIIIDSNEIVFHRPHSFNAKFFHKNAGQYKFMIIYNEQLFEPNWFADIQTLQTQNHIEISINNSLFNPRSNHDIQLIVTDRNRNIIARHEFTKPYCPIEVVQPIVNWANFEVPDHLKILFFDLSYESRANPSLVASLVAQESSFNPKAVSWAKALGLTQVTNIAAEEIEYRAQDWKVDQRISKLSYPMLKYYIATGKITSNDDWRLDQKKSLLGGVYYLNHLKEYWEKEENIELLNQLNSSTKKEEVILASYNSGASRVKYAIKRHGNKWLDSKKLNEARNYVNSVLSYCHDFTK